MIGNSQKHSVIIVGGGMVGLTLAAILSQFSIDVVVVEARQPLLNWEKSAYDARVSAIHQASHRLFQHLNLWPLINAECYSPIRAMKVWDGIGGGNIQFDSAGIGESELGYIIENRELIRTLWQHLQQQENVTFYCPGFPESLHIHNGGVELTLNSQKVTAQLIVGADGANSWVRHQAKIKCDERPYRHESLVAVIKTEKPHQEAAYQNFLPQGPLALLPLHDSHQMAIVWSTLPQRADELTKLDLSSFNRELTNATELCLGPLSLLSDLIRIPLTERHAQNYIGQRLALIGDAAHTIHPLAGQGVNLGLMDAACLAQSLMEAKQKKIDLGNWRPLRRYERWRKADNLTMLSAMKIFQELFNSQSQVIIQIRNAGMNFTDRLPFIKKYFMRYAMGDYADLPEIVK